MVLGLFVLLRWQRAALITSSPKVAFTFRLLRLNFSLVRQGADNKAVMTPHFRSSGTFPVNRRLLPGIDKLRSCLVFTASRLSWGIGFDCRGLISFLSWFGRANSFTSYSGRNKNNLEMQKILEDWCFWFASKEIAVNLNSSSQTIFRNFPIASFRSLLDDQFWWWIGFWLFHQNVEFRQEVCFVLLDRAGYFWT